MRIADLNVNDFGGYQYHREEYKKEFPKQYIKLWDNLDKTRNVEDIYKCLTKLEPAADVIILQEYDINSKEAKMFEHDMEKAGYVLISELPSIPRPSMTVMFVKNDLDYKHVSNGHKNRYLRACAIEACGYLLYGTHVPPKYDEKFWKEMHKFTQKNIEKKLVMIGDFNTINGYNARDFKSLLDLGVRDVWAEKGNTTGLSIPGDYVLVSSSIKTEDIEIEDKELDMTDHPLIFVSLP